MINGILNIYKEAGYTSHDVVAKLRGLTHQKKIGHTGTLDPAAVGVLPVCLGKATKVCGLLTDMTKTYEATLLLGVTTDTQDLTGRVLTRQPTAGLSEAAVRTVIDSFRGDIWQVPPMYSALKVNGRKLYELARAGQEVERAPRPVVIEDIAVLDLTLPRAVLRVTCSKGTYIRTLCHDIGARLGCGGAMEHLIRTRVGAYELADALSLTAIAEKLRQDRLADILQPLDAVFARYEARVVRAEAAFPAYNGQPLRPEQLHDGKPLAIGATYRVYDEDKAFIGLYEYDAEILRLKKMFYVSERQENE